MKADDSYWTITFRQFRKRPLGLPALFVVILFCLVGIYAPFLASSKPLAIQYDGMWYFPLFRYLFFTGFFTKRLDIFFNLLMFTLPLGALFIYLWHKRPPRLLSALALLLITQVSLFFFFTFGTAQDPAVSITMNQERRDVLKTHPLPDWSLDLRYMTPYAKLNMVLRAQQRELQQRRLHPFQETFQVGEGKPMPTLWQLDFNNEETRIKADLAKMKALSAIGKQDSEAFLETQANKRYIEDKRQWIAAQMKLLKGEVMPLLCPFHWEDDAGGSQHLNRYVSFWDLTRTNRKNLVAALIFGVRISLVVGLLSVSIALSIALPIGSFAGFYGGKTDIVVSRLLEVWESMPTFFMLLLVVAIMQSKSIFLVIIVIGIFGWTTMSRFVRGEFFKQRHLPYVEACRAIGLNDSRIMFSHILPNAIPPILTLLPFSIMGAITSEAGLSFLGLGEEGSCSWGVLMDEGRTAFPAESYLLWPPAILLITLLIAIALVGDAMRDALDPKMHK